MTLSMFMRLFVVVLAVLAMPGCEVVGGIFKAGMFVGILMVVLVVGVVFFLVGKMRKRA